MGVLVAGALLVGCLLGLLILDNSQIDVQHFYVGVLDMSGDHTQSEFVPVT